MLEEKSKNNPSPVQELSKLKLFDEAGHEKFTLGEYDDASALFVLKALIEADANFPKKDDYSPAQKRY